MAYRYAIINLSTAADEHLELMLPSRREASALDTLAPGEGRLVNAGNPGFRLEGQFYPEPR